MQVSVNTANQYFSNRFWDKDAWTLLTNEARVSALATAETDINAVLGTDTINKEVIKISPPFSFYQKAVFEWALYLSGHKDEIVRAIAKSASGIVSREVEGFGKEVYSRVAGSPLATIDGYSELIKNSPAGRMLSAIKDDKRVIR